MTWNVNFKTGEKIPIHIGRIIVGNVHSVRIVFDTDQIVKLVIPKEAIDDKSILISDIQNDSGLGLAPVMT